MYYIYHIPGVKIGCSKHPDKRVKQQKFTVYEILEQYLDKRVAAKRELELQKEYGYRVDKVLYGNQPDRSGIPQKDFHKQKIGKAVRKSNSLYKELSTGLEGSCRDLVQRLNCSPMSIYWSIKRGPITQGRNKGLHFVILSPGARRN